MDCNQSNCKNYFNLNTNTFYYEPQPAVSMISDNRSKGLNGESILDSSINSSDYTFKQPYSDGSTVDVVYQTIEDSTYIDDFHSLNNRHHHSTFHTNPTYAYPTSSSCTPIEHQTEHTNSVLADSDVQQYTEQGLPSIYPFSTVQQNVANSQQTTKQLSVNVSMNMTMDIKSMDFKSINSNPTASGQSSSDYDHVMNDVVSNVANKLVTNFNTNLLSPTNQTNLLRPQSPQKDYQFYSHTYSNQAAKSPYSLYNSPNNSTNYYNQRYHNTIQNTAYHYTPNDSNHHFLNHHHNNDYYELYQPNWTECNNSSLTTSSLASNLNSLSNLSFASNDTNFNHNNDYLINYSNNFLNSIGNRSSISQDSSTDDSSLESPYRERKRKLEQFNNLHSSYTSNVENDNQKALKIETNALLKKDRQDINSVLRVRSNENRKEIDFYHVNSGEKLLDKKIRSIKTGNLCLLCGKSYARPSTLKTHLRTHSNERPYSCLTCLKTFTQAANLTAHLRTHSGEKPFQCTICFRNFSQSSSVTTHKRTHSGERPYRCGVCRKAFSDSSTLTKHLRIHTGDKPYQCQLCQLKFSQSGNLNRHMRIHNFN